MGCLPLAQNLPSELPPEVVVGVCVMLGIALVVAATVLYGMAETAAFFVKRARRRKTEHPGSD